MPAAVPDGVRGEAGGEMEIGLMSQAELLDFCVRPGPLQRPGQWLSVARATLPTAHSPIHTAGGRWVSSTDDA